MMYVLVNLQSFNIQTQTPGIKKGTVSGYVIQMENDLAFAFIQGVHRSDNSNQISASILTK